MSSDARTEGQEKVLQIRRCACVVKGGRRFSFTALVVVGNQQGRVGYGYGKGLEVPMAVEKAVKQAHRKMVQVPVVNQTIPHRVIGRFGSSRVLLLPAAPGTGVIAGNTVRAILESAGVRNVLTKARGSTNPINLAKATVEALLQLRTRDDVARLRGVKV